jgi:hypothetical protein
LGDPLLSNMDVVGRYREVENTGIFLSSSF